MAPAFSDSFWNKWLNIWNIDSTNHEVEDNTPDQVLDDVEDNVGLINEPVSTDEVTTVLTSLRNGKATGPEGIIGDI